jgi:hypothetical protein
MTLKLAKAKQDILGYGVFNHNLARGAKKAFEAKLGGIRIWVEAVSRLCVAFRGLFFGDVQN